MNITINKIFNGAKEIAKGMYTIIKHVFRPPITLEYPEKKPCLPARTRGRLALTTNREGALNCIGCMACTKVCPCGDLIQIKANKDENNKMHVERFTIDLGRCIFLWKLY